MTTDPATWPTVADQRPPLGARCDYFVKGDGWSSSDVGAWIPSGCFQLDDGHYFACNPAQTRWRLADGPAVPEGREPASVAPEAKPLSPAAQAVLDAVCDAPHCGSGRAKAVAALRALADHRRAPITPGQPIDHWSPDERTRQELRNLATDLAAPTLLDRALAGDPEAARQFLHKAGIIGADGQLAPQYRTPES